MTAPAYNTGGFSIVARGVMNRSVEVFEAAQTMRDQAKDGDPLGVRASVQFVEYKLVELESKIKEVRKELERVDNEVLAELKEQEGLEPCKK